MMVLPQDCFEVCNDYECLYLCPQPPRGVKRCITALKSNKKSCCQNGQKESSTGTDNIKTAGKHIWQAREQLLGIKKELENDLANRRYSLLKGLQPLSLKQHNRDSLFKLGTKTSKPKTNTVPVVCPVNVKKITNSPKNCVNTNHAGGGADDDNENHIPQKLPFYSEEQLSREKENGQMFYNNDEPGEISLPTTIVPVLRNENVEDIREQVSAPHSDLVFEGKEEIQNSFTDVSGSAGILQSGPDTSDTDISKSSYYNDRNASKVEESNSQHILNQPSPFSSSDMDRTHNYNNAATITNNGETETIGKKVFQSVPVIYYADSYTGSPMEIKNNVLSQTSRDDFSYTTPLMYAYTSSDIRKPSKLETAENIGTVNINSGETYDTPLTELQNTMQTTPGSIGDNQSEINDNVLVESNDELIANDSKSYTYADNGESFSPFPTKGNSLPKIANIEESTSSKTSIREEKIPSDNLERVLAENYLRPEDNEHQALSPSEMNKTDVKFLLSNETDVGNEIINLNASENNFYVEKDEMEDSSNKFNDTERSYDYLNDESSSNINEKPEKNIRVEHKNSLLEILKLSASANSQKQNYTYRILQDLISRYNITSDLKGGGTNAPECQPLSSSSDLKTSKHYFTQEKPIINSNLTSQSTDILQNESNENVSYSTDDTTRDQNSSKSISSKTHIVMSKLDVENEMEEESIHETSNTEINDEPLSNVPSNNSTRGIHNGQNTRVENSSNILKSFRFNDELGRSNGISYLGENTTSGSLEAITSITKDNKSNTTIGDIVNGISLDNGSASDNPTIISSSHFQVSRAEQARTTTSVYLFQKGSLKNSTLNNDSQVGFHPNQSGKTIFHIITNDTDEKLENKNTNISENQFYVESNIEEPMFENNSGTSNESVNGMKNSEIVDQELLYEAGDSESSNNSANYDHIANMSVNGSVDEQLYNETYGNNLYDQSEKVLQLIPNVSEIPSPKTFDDKSTEKKNHGIEEVYLRLEESNENSSRNIDNDNNYNDLYRPKNPDELSTELNDSESHAMEEKRGDSIINKKKLNDIINTELNSIKQQNVILKKREEEEMSYSDDPLCDCDNTMSRDEEPGHYPSSGANTYFHHVYPMFIVVPVPYSVSDSKNKTNYNSLYKNQINSLDPYVPREDSEPAPDYSFNSDYNNFQHEREGKAVRAPSYMPNLFFPFVPWGGIYNMAHPYHQVIDQRDENDSQPLDATNEKDEKLGTTTYSNPSEEGLKNSNSRNIAEIHQDFVSTPSPTENQRFLRHDHKQTGTIEYAFVDGQYVKVSKDDADRTEERPTTVTEPSIPDTSTTAPYIYSTQEPFPVDKIVTNFAMDTNYNGHRPINYFYPADFGGAQNRFYGYYPGYFFSHRR